MAFWSWLLQLIRFALLSMIRDSISRPESFYLCIGRSAAIVSSDTPFNFCNVIARRPLAMYVVQPASTALLEIRRSSSSE